MVNTIGKLVDLKSICIITLVVFFMTSNVYAHDDDKATSKYLTITSHPTNHLVGETVTISGKYVNSTNHFIQETILLKAYDMKKLESAVDKDEVDELGSAKAYSTNGRFQVKEFAFSKSGDYQITATSESGTLANYEVHITDLYWTGAFYIAIFAGLSLVALLYIMSRIGKSKSRMPVSYYRVSRFSLITVIVFCMLLFFIFSNVEYGTQSPVGIILQEPTISEDTTDSIVAGLISPLKLDWVLHFGAYSVNDGDKNIGISIPLYILIFGVLGGYLRFFYFTSRPWLRNEMLHRLDDTSEAIPVYDEDGNQVEVDGIKKFVCTDEEMTKYEVIMANSYVGRFHPILSMVLTNRIMSDLSLLFIAPVLAVMMFFVLSQSGLEQSEHVLSFAVSSFVAGLFTEDVIKKLKSSQENDDKGDTKSNKKTSKNEKNPK